jgi:hypothetical protein
MVQTGVTDKPSDVVCRFASVERNARVGRIDLIYLDANDLRWKKKRNEN